MADDFRPVLYLKRGCPFGFKLRVFLLDAGLLDRFSLEEFEADTDDEKLVRDKLARHFDKVSFPAGQTAPGRFEKDSDMLISLFAEEAGINPAQFGTYQAYVDGPFKMLMSLYKENAELKKQAA